MRHQQNSERAFRYISVPEEQMSLEIGNLVELFLIEEHESLAVPITIIFGQFVSK